MKLILFLITINKIIPVKNYTSDMPISYVNQNILTTKIPTTYYLVPTNLLFTVNRNL